MYHDTDGMQAPGHATSTALEITELLEAILSSADRTLHDLFVLRRVSRVWKSTIENSKMLQRESYSFVQSTKTVHISRMSAFVDKGLLDSLIMKTGFFTRHSRADAEWDSPQAFFRKLAVCSPPVSTMSVRIRYFKHPDDAEKIVRRTNHSSSGVTLDDLWDAIVRTMKAAARGSERNRLELEAVEVSTGAGSAFAWTRVRGVGFYSLPAR